MHNTWLAPRRALKRGIQGRAARARHLSKTNKLFLLFNKLFDDQPFDRMRSTLTLATVPF